MGHGIFFLPLKTLCGPSAVTSILPSPVAGFMTSDGRGWADFAHAAVNALLIRLNVGASLLLVRQRGAQAYPACAVLAKEWATPSQTSTSRHERHNSWPKWEHGNMWFRVSNTPKFQTSAQFMSKHVITWCLQHMLLYYGKCIGKWLNPIERGLRKAVRAVCGTLKRMCVVISLCLWKHSILLYLPLLHVTIFLWRPNMHQITHTLQFRSSHSHILSLSKYFSLLIAPIYTLH